ncbi:MAG: ribonuclease HII [Christensenella sp.]|uniref:ribonuclease HII n=1 Tax=Christensenella sp. TaxID=1935934 RepID=UPI002B205B76|nr:ribonuclease HII [Christensenella sp.]MEA5003076.1 ribonuclease HII [Christensenella sp.]
MGKREEKQQEKLADMTEYEKLHWAQGQYLIAGIDEVGRGPLAGPVVAACVIMPKDDLILGIDDSKKISEKRREALYELIVEKAVDYSVSVIDNNIIDEINILNAARMAFENALNGLHVRPEHVYTDAMTLNTEIPYTSLIKGDAKVYTIAAASILAKVTRDNMMREYDAQYPQYGFARHKGYGTQAHYDAIREHGILEIHRKTFLKKILGE